MIKGDMNDMFFHETRNPWIAFGMKSIEDMVSIDQSDPQKIEDGIYGIGGFLNVTLAGRRESYVRSGRI